MAQQIERAQKKGMSVVSIHNSFPHMTTCAVLVLAAVAEGDIAELL
jgi:LDH2 family malate/lactate/ureidoglycolate dehydrogenase